MTRDNALPYIGHCLDNALSVRTVAEMPTNARLIGWQCGFEPMFVAVWSYLGDTQGNPDRLDDDAAIEIATDYLAEIKWFSGGEPTEPDYVL